MRRRFYAINTRCSKRVAYLEKGIKNLFESSDAFVRYVVEVLKVDPRGLEIHRKDNDGHYEPGNIIFLTPGEHMSVHAKMR